MRSKSFFGKAFNGKSIGEKSPFLKPVRITAVMIAAVMLITASLAGCSADEIDLFTAIVSAPQMTSYEYEGNVKVDLAFDIFEQEGYVNSLVWPPVSMLKTIEELVNGAGVNINAKFIGNEENTAGAMEMQMTPVYMGGRLENLKTGIWADIDLDKPDFMKEYFKLPRIISAGIAWDYLKGREYLTFTTDDLDMIIEESGVEMGGLLSPEALKAQVQASLDFSETLKTLYIQIAKLINTKSAYIKNVETDKAGNTVYNVKITDQGLKELLSGIVNMDKKDMKEIIRLFLNATMEYLKAIGFYENEAYEEYMDSLDLVLSQFDIAYDTFYPMIISEINKYIGKNSRVKLLGNDGITLNISFSKDGYITACDGIIDIIVDIRGFTIASGERFTGTISKTRIKLTFDSLYTNINKDVPVDMPVITPSNSMSFSRLMKTIADQQNSYVGNQYDLDPYFALEREALEDEGVQEKPDMLGEIPDEDAAVKDAADGFSVIEPIK